MKRDFATIFIMLIQFFLNTFVQIYNFHLTIDKVYTNYNNMVDI